MSEKPKVAWICEVTTLATKTIIVYAESKKAAYEELVYGDGGEGIDVSYGDERSRRVIRRDNYVRKP